MAVDCPKASLSTLFFLGILGLAGYYVFTSTETINGQMCVAFTIALIALIIIFWFCLDPYIQQCMENALEEDMRDLYIERMIQLQENGCMNHKYRTAISNWKMDKDKDLEKNNSFKKPIACSKDENLSDKYYMDMLEDDKYEYV